jgi:hypothetical protein
MRPSLKRSSTKTNWDGYTEPRILEKQIRKKRDACILGGSSQGAARAITGDAMQSTVIKPWDVGTMGRPKHETYQGEEAEQRTKGIA